MSASSAGAVDDGGLFLGDDDNALGGTEVVQGGLLEGHADFFGDHGATGQNSDVLQHGLATITEARRLDGGNLDDAADGVDHQGGQGFAFNVLGDDQQRRPALAAPSSSGQQVADVGDLLVVQQDEGLFQSRRLVLLVVDEVGREVAAVELHAFDDVELVLQAWSLLQR